MSALRRFAGPAAVAAGLCLSFAVPAPLVADDDAWIPLFNGKNLDGWDVWLGRPKGEPQSIGLNKDEKKVFSVVAVDGKPVIRISGEIPGAITSQKEYGDYHLRVAFKWGEKNWRSNFPRDGGMLYHCVGPQGAQSGNWMESLECEVMVGRCTSVIVSHGSAGMHAYDFSGQELWKTDLGKLEHIWGNASSPILHGDLAILWCGPGERQFLLAVNKKTGARVWEHQEPGGLFGKTSSEWHGSWSTPLMIKVGDQDQLVLSVPNKLKGFDPSNGKELWTADGLGKLVYTSPLYENGVIVSLGGPSGQLSLKVGGTGDVTKASFRFTKGSNWRVGSGVIVGEHVYHLEGNGVPRCWELKTGKDIWQVAERPSSAACWGSMVYGDGRLYVTNQNGDTLVFAASPAYEFLGINRLGEHTNASVAISHGHLFIRTYKHLWCIGSGKE